jgi:Carboxypeptidase regulatory-like domain
MVALKEPPPRSATTPTSSRAAQLPVLAIEGRVVTTAGEPVSGAVVSAWSHLDLAARDAVHEELTDAQGCLSFASLPPGSYGVTASVLGAGTGYGHVTVPPAAAPQNVALRLVSGGVKIAGTIRDETGAVVPNARVILPSNGDNEDEVYATRADAQGRYSLTVPAQTGGMLLLADALPRPRASVGVATSARVVDIALAPPPAPRPTDESIAAWLRARATPLDPARDLDAAQARALSEIVADAPLVGLGEASHGSAEFPGWAAADVRSACSRQGVLGLRGRGRLPRCSGAR